MPLRSIVEFLAFSSLLPAAVAFALTGWSAWLLEAPTPGRWAGLAAAGTFAVYGVDRLRDLERDRDVSPARAAFVARHRTKLRAAIVVAGIAFAAMLVIPARAPLAVFGACAAVGALGLLHRRLKKRGGASKVLYVGFAWLGCVFGVPWLAAGRPQDGLGLALALAAVLGANLVAAGLRDAAPDRRARGLAIARGLAVASLGVVALAPAAAWPIGWVALAELVALLRFESSERHRLVALDGALLLGCALAAGQAALFPTLG